MSIVKTMITQKDFQPKILPHILSIRLSSRGKKSKIGYYKLYCYMLYKAKSGCQWRMLSIDNKEITNFFEKIFKASVALLKSDHLAGQLSEINLDGTHSLAKNGAEAVAY